MEAYLIENESVLRLDTDSTVEIIETELTLKEGRRSQGTDGRIDILVKYDQEYLGVVELKIGKLEETHLSQLEDYLDEKDQLLTKFPDIFDQESMTKPKWVGVLVGSEISSGLRNKIKAGYKTTKSNIPIAALTIKRFRGVEGNVYVLTNTYFGGYSQIKDSTKYEFRGKVYGKGRVVLEVIKRYVEDHPNITFSELERIFPKNCQGNTGVFSSLDLANDIYTRTGYKRHFFKPSELITISDTTIAVSNQWGIGNINEFISKAKAQDYLVDEV